MSVDTVQDVALSEIPDFDGGVSSCRHEVSSVWMESDLVDLVICSVVMLDKSLTSDIPDFKGVIG